MNGAENLLLTLEQSGIDVCFANPGTSEMQLVSAIGNSPNVRAVLCLFEGVVSGAADGYGRMTDKPALTLLHVGSGYANSMANQHNAMRAHTPVVNMVGDHATYHLKYDSPLTSNVEAHAQISSSWVRTSESADDLARAGAEAVQASLQGAGRIATFIAPANHAWEESSVQVPPLPAPEPIGVLDETIDDAAERLRKDIPTAILLGGPALREETLHTAGRIARACNATLLCETFPARIQRGAGRVRAERLPYFAEQVSEMLAPFQQIIMVGARPPVSFFAYPGKESWLTPEGCSLYTLADVDHAIAPALEALADRLNATEPPETVQAATHWPEPTGPLTPEAVGMVVASRLPENAIVVDEANTCGLALYPFTENAPAHDWLCLTGGAIGIGLPLGLGAAIACPDRKVIALQADGSAMYTVQALWSMAREHTDVTIVVMNNSSYAILNIELMRVGAGQPTPKTLSMLDLSRPDIDWVSLSESMGVPATRAETAGQLNEQLLEAIATPGPRLVEAVILQQMPGG